MGKMAPDELAFLTAICSKPEDDVVRLAFADWLDEHSTDTCGKCGGDTLHRHAIEQDGKKFLFIHKDRGTCAWCDGHGTVSNGTAERAEFIRVQCELAKLPTPEPGHCEACGGGLNLGRWHHACLPERDRQDALRRRERELIEEHDYEWFAFHLDPLHWTACLNPSPHLQPAPNDMLVIPRRGFIEKIITSAADWLALADALYWRPDQTVECPKCKGCGVTANDAGDCLKCQRCDGETRVPRPCPPTAQPVTTVQLTTFRTAVLFAPWLRYANEQEWWSLRWPGVTFELPVAERPSAPRT